MIAPAVNEPAVVLHRQPFRESSSLLDLLTKSQGRVKCISHGRGRKKSSIGAFVEYRVSWRGRTDLVTLTSCEPLQSFDLRGKTLFSGSYLNELILRAVAQGVCLDGLFDAYLSALTAFGIEDDVEPVLRTFEKGLLKGLGYEIEFEREFSQRSPIEVDRDYTYVPRVGFKLTDSVAEQTYSGETLLSVARNDYSKPQTRRAAKYIFRQALRHHIGDRPLKSRELFLNATSASQA